MNHSSDEKAIERFFDVLGEAMNSTDTATLLPFYHLPSVFVSHDDKTVCSTVEQMQARLSHIIRRSSHSDAIQYQATIVHAMPLSDSIWFAKVQWHINSVEPNAAITFSTSYTLEYGGDCGFRIIVSVIDEEEQAVKELHSKLEP